MMKFVFSLIFAFFLIATRGEAQNTEKLVSDIHTHIHNGNMEPAYMAYKQLKRKVSEYMGWYSGTFELYISVCTENLNLNIGEDEIAKFYRMCISGKDVTNRTKGKLLSEFASTLCDYGHSSLALTYYQELLKLENDLEPVYFYRYLIDLGWAYNQNQMPQKAFLTFKKCADFYKSRYGKWSKNYANALTCMAYVARFINVDNLNLLLEEQSIHVHNADTLTNQYAVCLDNIGGYYFMHDNPEKALSYALRANRIFKETNAVENDLAISYNNIGGIYQNLSINDSSLIPLAKNFLLQSMEIAPTNSAALNLALFYDHQEKLPDKALEYYNRLGEYNKHNVYAKEVGEHYARIGDYATYASYMEEYINYTRMVQQQNVLYMSALERSNYIKMIQNENMKLLFDSAAESRHKSLPGLCFNYLLMSKSLLLSYDSSIDEIIKRSKNKELKDMYFSLSILQHNLKRKPILKEKVDSVEHLFLDKLSKENNFSSFTSLEYNNIQECLRDDDAIVEFYEDKSSSSPRLYAVILTAHDLPSVIDCCSVEEEKKWGKQQTLAQSLWTSLEPALKKKKRIFFVPDGNLHNYPLESYMSLLYSKSNIFRISSSRELVKKYSEYGKGAAIYGGLNFNMGIDQMIADNSKYRNVTAHELECDEISTQSIRYSVSQLAPLPGTLTEANNIAAIISSKKKTDVQPFLGDKGTEASFKALSGKRKRILHIATHGYYYEGHQQKGDDEQNALMYSGLFFAGANNKYMDYFVPDSIDDGILTAQEISELDFRGIELVGLSACQTAQGKITGDGVFGLQRGFKKAGVNGILMSLWKVDDEATCLLMTEFYRNWINKGINKHESLEKAKQAVRSHKEKGWDDPKYWAAFILLDGID